jgi:hypothetical protein
MGQPRHKSAERWRDDGACFVVMKRPPIGGSASTPVTSAT